MGAAVFILTVHLVKLLVNT